MSLESGRDFTTIVEQTGHNLEMIRFENQN